MSRTKIRALFSDIGGVLGTNGWDTVIRQKVIARFDVDQAEIEALHHLMFDSYERGYMDFDAYLQKVFFTSSHSFTVEEIREFTFAASTPWHENIDFFHYVKRVNNLKLGLISNEGQGLAEYRVEKFGLRDLADFMVISYFVNLRKPDPEIWQLALNLVQLKPAETIYIDDREAFVRVAEELGLISIHHVSLSDTKKRFQEIGLL